MALPRHRSLSLDTTIAKFTNCFILRDHKIIKEDLWVRGGKILNPENVFYYERKTPDEVVDCNGALVAPGFIDIQINGGFGVDFTHDVDNIDEGVTKVGQAILAHGVTAFCPTIVSSTPDVYKKLLPRLRKRIGSAADGAAVLGVHLEGPFINLTKKGAHDPSVIQNGFPKGFDTIKEVYGPMQNVIIMTLAPELPNALSVIERLCNEKVIVSLGHSTANFDTGQAAVEKGASFVTHMFNAMMPFHHRDPGLVGLIVSKKPVKFGLIADGSHTHATTLRMAHCANPENVVLVTDAISAYGLPEGTHHLGNFSIDIKNGEAYISNTDTLCGSITGFIDCVKYFKEATGCTLVQALEAGSLHPAQVLKIEKLKGTLNYGADADFILLNDKLDVIQTWIGGCRVYKNDDIEDHVFKYEPQKYGSPSGSLLNVASKRHNVVYFNV